MILPLQGIIATEITILSKIITTFAQNILFTVCVFFAAFIVRIFDTTKTFGDTAKISMGASKKRYENIKK